VLNIKNHGKKTSTAQKLRNTKAEPLLFWVNSVIRMNVIEFADVDFLKRTFHFERGRKLLLFYLLSRELSASFGNYLLPLYLLFKSANSCFIGEVLPVKKLPTHFFV
jgi:hypothetical protein